MLPFLKRTNSSASCVSTQSVQSDQSEDSDDSSKTKNNEETEMKNIVLTLDDWTIPKVPQNKIYKISTFHSLNAFCGYIIKTK